VGARRPVEADTVSRRFGEVVALHELSFQVGDGELFGVVGPDGAGKTTLLRILAGILPPTDGDVRVLGWSMVSASEGPKSQLAYMPQRFGLYEDLTVDENLSFYADLYRVPRSERPARLERLFHFSGLGPFRGRLAGNLSGGMKQKLALSCCLIHEPTLLLLDEPTFGVDPVSRRELWLILHEMVARGVTLVVSTSYLDEAERCDRVLLLNEGRLMEMDTPGRLVATLPGVLVEVRVAEPRRARDLLRRLGEVEGATLFGENLRVVLSSVEGWDAAEVALIEAGLELHQVRRIEPSLEDVFTHRMAGRGGAQASASIGASGHE
jgi:ABC-2 type transport system ATP-binding protein